jgi:uncharacterized protein (TIGR03000 family)
MLRFIALLAFSVVLLIPAEASAQRRGGFGGGRNWNGNQGYGSGNYNSWNRGYNNWNQSGNRNYYGGYSGFGIGGYFGGINNGGIYGGYNSYPYGSYGQTGYYSFPGTRYSSGYFDASVDGATINQVNNTYSNRARVDVILPDPNADLIIQGQRMDVTGRNRAFVSPDLASGKVFTYTITMRRTTNGRNEDDTRKIEVQAGSNSTVDFNIPASQQTIRPDGRRDEREFPLPR